MNVSGMRGSGSLAEPGSLAGQGSLSGRLDEERSRIAHERWTMVKDGLFLLFIAVALTAFLMVWRAEITGMAALDERSSPCVDDAGFEFHDEGPLVLASWNGYSHVLELSCPGDVVLQEDSPYVDIPESGVVHIVGDADDVPESFEFHVIAELRSGDFIVKRYSVEMG